MDGTKGCILFEKLNYVGMELNVHVLENHKIKRCHNGLTITSSINILISIFNNFCFCFY